MKKNGLFHWILVGLLYLPVQVYAEGIWVLCDHCSSDSSFASVALNATQEGTIFVSNRASRETRKYFRVVQWDRLEQVFRARVTPKPLSDTEERVFSSAIEGGNTAVIVTSRNGSDMTQWGISAVDSVVEDLANGHLNPALINALSNQLLMNGLFPTASGLSQSLGISIKGLFNWSGRELGTSRSSVLNVTMTYPDDSRLFITFSTLGEVISVSGVDAGGRGLALTYSASRGAAIDPGRTGAWEFGGTAVAAAEALGAWIGGAGPLECHFEELANDRVRVTCVRD
ncbi:MAG: hypothetical protein ACLFQ2_07215 [Wenzhouxiangella sp.]